MLTLGNYSAISFSFLRHPHAQGEESFISTFYFLCNLYYEREWRFIFSLFSQLPPYASHSLHSGVVKDDITQKEVNIYWEIHINTSPLQRPPSLSPSPVKFTIER